MRSSTVDWNLLSQYIEGVSNPTVLYRLVALSIIPGPALVVFITVAVALHNRHLCKKIDNAIDEQLLPKQLSDLQNEKDSQEYVEKIKQCANQISINGSVRPVDCADVFTLGLQVWCIISVVLMMLTNISYLNVPDYYRGSSDYINMWVSVHTDENLMSEVKEIEELFYDE